MTHIQCIDPTTDPLWPTLLARHETRVFHSPSWIQVLNDTYDFTVRANLLLDDSGAPQAGLTYCEIEDMRGKRIAVMPFSDYCDPLVRTDAEWQALVAPLLAQNCPVTVRCLQSDVPGHDGRFKQYYQAKWHGLDLRPDEDTLWSQLNSAARRAVRKAEKSGVTVRLAQDIADLRAFFNMHLHIRKYRYQLLAQPYRFFEQIWQKFVEPGHGTILLAEHDNTIIGGIFFLEWQDGLYYKFNASLTDLRDVRPNDLMMWEGIKYGRSRRLAHMDFGLSDWDQEGLIRYKRKFASDERAIAFLRHTPDLPPDPRAQQIGGLLPKLTDLFTDASVPDAVTENAGDLLYRFFV
ncbi:MAG: GNAT family N-acetyltransferase [Anaerolineales bacterium]|nr:GNAT family N-acetyltransferase [Anaerolineales bacterium]